MYYMVYISPSLPSPPYLLCWSYCSILYVNVWGPISCYVLSHKSIEAAAYLVPGSFVPLFFLYLHMHVHRAMYRSRCKKNILIRSRACIHAGSIDNLNYVRTADMCLLDIFYTE